MKQSNGKTTLGKCTAELGTMNKRGNDCWVGIGARLAFCSGWAWAVSGGVWCVVCVCVGVGGVRGVTQPSMLLHGVLSDNNYVGHKVFELRPFKDGCTDANIEIHY